MAHKYAKFFLQLFAEGASAGVAEGTSSADVGTSTTDSDVGAERQPIVYQSKRKKPSSALSTAAMSQTQPAESSTETTTEEPKVEDAQARYKALMSGEFKDLYTKDISAKLSERMKTANKQIEELNKIKQILPIFADKYGLTAEGSIDDFVNAIKNDTSLLEAQAAEKGMTKEAYAEYLKANQKLAQYEAERKEREQAEIRQRFEADTAKVQSVYPSYDVSVELQNPQFTAMLKSGVDQLTAYQAIHHNEILNNVIPVAMKKAKDSVIDMRRINNDRPDELGGGSPANYKPDVTKLTREERAALAKRAMMGDTVTFR